MSEATTEFGQYRLRHALMGVTVVAVLLAAAAPWMREWTPSQWWRFGCHFLGAIGGLAFQGMLGVIMLRRSRSSLGEIRHKLTCQPPAWSDLLPFFCGSLAILMTAVSLLPIVSFPKTPSPPELWYLNNFMFGAVSVQNLLVAAWRWAFRHQLLLGNTGVMCEGHFVAWKSVRYVGTAGAPRIRIHGISYGITSGNPATVHEFLAQHARPA